MASSPMASLFTARRADFPSLGRAYKGHTLAYLDGPAGTQVPQQVIEAIAGYYRTCNANTHGQFITTRESDAMIEAARETSATFLGAEGKECISFGANMTTLSFSLSKAIARQLRPGDEILITQLDHEANRAPWLTLREQGVVVREIAIRKDATLDYNDFRGKVNERTRLVAMGWASNAFGTVNDIGLVREITYRIGAWLLVDAVHYAPHFPMDVRPAGIDFLLCSAYKFYGPHVGILYARKGLLDQLQTDRLRTIDPRSPWRIETGTLNHAAIAGVKAAIDYIASLGKGETQRARMVSAMESIASYEHRLGAKAYAGLARIPGVTVYGQTFRSERRAPTISFTVEGKRAEEVSALLGEMGLCTWNGHFYAIRPVEILGLLERGGVTRIGFSLYNTADEVERLLEGVREIARSSGGSTH
jgi:cysteine desulfurase family protein (TIGR01976 family)